MVFEQLEGTFSSAEEKGELSLANSIFSGFPWNEEKEMATHSSILAWRIPIDRGPWWDTDHEVSKSQT